ncbi:hypothetical protein DPMN_057802 [Dreissena polymorpha]|uniref:Ig-like domain-containing protein n=1 Tax=Dreissena polymorpha TaxID=45954 RepID=A0A9D4C0U3_DREPO|nr:hypothetical protein DPMN_057802 [Dreissena polymorpha]
MSTPVNLTSVLLTPNAQTFPKYNEPSIYTCITSTTKPGAAIHWFEDVHNITDIAGRGKKIEHFSSRFHSNCVY